MMYALTVQRPWAGLIAAGWKDVENRSWNTTLRGLLAIHAGQTVDHSRADWIIQTIRSTSLLLTDEELVDIYETAAEGPTGVVAVTTVHTVTTASFSRWAEPGQFHWCLVDTYRLPEPVPCRGRQGLWGLPCDVEAAVRRQIPAP